MSNAVFTIMSTDDAQERLELLKRLRRAEEAVYLPAGRLRESVSEATVRRELEQIKASLAYRIGRLLVDTVRNPVMLLAWPGFVLSHVRARRTYRDTSKTKPIADGNSNCPPRLVGPVESVATQQSSHPSSEQGLRIAAICDRFTADGLSPECELLSLSTDSWRDELQSFRPHLLLVESAWQGNGGQWARQVSPISENLSNLVTHCRGLGIPTLFWNKEDPLHFEAFIPTAVLFDHVFTTDADMIGRYRRALGHDRVHLLTFALQPRLHHPILAQGEQRSASAFFAGAWYAHLPSRCGSFVRLVDAVMLAMPVEIFDRNHARRDPAWKYPDRYSAVLCGGVQYEDTPALYRSHAIGLTVNTVTQSSTMFARRALELIGCNTRVFSNHNRALQLMFGDLVLATDDGDLVLEAAWAESRQPDSLISAVRRLRALRKVLIEHTWSARLSDIGRIVWGSNWGEQRQKIVVLSHANSTAEAEYLANLFFRQEGVSAELWLRAADDVELPRGVNALTSAQLSMPPADSWPRAMLAPLSTADCYGAHYLQDLLLALKFGQAKIVGKSAYFSFRDGQEHLVDGHLEYRTVPSLALRRVCMPTSAWQRKLVELLDEIDTGVVEGSGLISIDRLSYLHDGAGGVLPEESVPNCDEGASVGDIQRLAALRPALTPINSGALPGSEVASWFDSSDFPSCVSVGARWQRMEIVRKAGVEGTVSLASRPVPRRKLAHNDTLRLHLDMTAKEGVKFEIEQWDDRGRTVARRALPPSTNVNEALLPQTTAFRLILRLECELVAYVDGLHLAGLPAQPPVLPGRGRVLLVTNQYPSEDRRYANAFVHRRVVGYHRRGIGVDVVRLAGSGEGARNYEYEGVPVQICTHEAVQSLLSDSGHSAIAIHFLDAETWRFLAPFAERLRIVVWVHGSDLQPWTRRPAHYATPDEVTAAKSASATRLTFWRELLKSPPSGLHLVFVSRTFAEQSWEDLGFRLPEDRWSVVPNPIDTELFGYVPKKAEQRFHILSIRPHYSPIYANDLVASTIIKLSDSPLFPEMRFTLMGDGPLWDETFASLREFGNVKLVRGFVSQSHIASLHKAHGIFLVPSRGDTHGVSRDEAMASGLVPITTEVGAIPEFVDDASGVICPPDDPDALANAIVDLLENPEKFLRLSSGASMRVEAQSAANKIIDVEARLIKSCESAG